MTNKFETDYEKIYAYVERLKETNEYNLTQEQFEIIMDSVGFLQDNGIDISAFPGFNEIA